LSRLGFVRGAIPPDAAHDGRKYEPAHTARKKSGTQVARIRYTIKTRRAGTFAPRGRATPACISGDRPSRQAATANRGSVLVVIHFDIVRDGRVYSARPDSGAKFVVGNRVVFRNRNEETVGLANDNSPLARQVNYAAANFTQAFGFWADFIAPTARCEGQSFITLNTYDRARFTFGFAQFAAHVPNGDFVKWFRDMLGLPEAPDYFPDLAVDGGRIVKVSTAGTTPLESATSTEGLLNYLNPSLSAIEDEEVVNAAKFIHWTINHAETQALQVKHMVENARALLVEADRRVDLDGKPAEVCCVVVDIRHQGRGTFPEILQAVRASDPVKALLTIGAARYAERIRTLRSALNAERTAFAAKHWDRTKKDFV
jgi:hypothetical protein